MKPLYVVMIGGTWSWRGLADTRDWFCPGSSYARRLLRRRFRGRPLVPVFWKLKESGTECPFPFDGDLQGIALFAMWLVSRFGWEAWGLCVYFYCVYVLGIDPDDLAIISHSHGRQPVVHAFAFGLRAFLWVDVCGPVRESLRETQVKALTNVRHVVRIYSDDSDFWQTGGQLFDGGVRWPFRWPKRWFWSKTPRIDPRVDPLIPRPGHDGDQQFEVRGGHSVFFRDDRDFELDAFTELQEVS